MMNARRTISTLAAAGLASAAFSLSASSQAEPIDAGASKSPVISSSSSSTGDAANSAGSVSSPVAETWLGGPVARTPNEALTLLGERIKAKDINGILALHERGAAIVTDFDGTVITGRENIKAFYLEWFKSNPILTVHPKQTVIAGEWYNKLATVMGHYTLTQDGPNGERVTFEGQFCDTIRRQADGRWLYVHDNPYPPHDAPH